MSRSLFFGSVRRLLQTAWTSQRNTALNREFPDGENEPWSPSRREFLQTSAVVSLAAFVPAGLGSGCGTPSDSALPEKARIAIVGAGMAGLHCAYRLKQAGVIAKVFEANNRVGGRMFTGRGLFADGQVCELGGEFIDSNHVAMRELATEFAITIDDLTAGASAGLIDELFYFEGRQIPEAEIVAAFEPLAAIMATTVEAAEADDDEFERIDAMSIVEWLDEQNAAPILKKILIEAYIGEYGLEAEEQSVFNLLYLIDYEEADPFHIFGDSDERYHVHTGSDTLTTRLAERLEGQIELESKLLAIRELQSGDYELSLNQSGQTIKATFDHVVLAIPFTTLRQVTLDVEMDDDKREAIDEIGYGTNAKLMGGFTSRLWREDHNASGSVFTDNGIQSLWDSSRGQSGTAGLLTNYVGGKLGEAIGAGTPEERMAESLVGIEDIFAGAAQAYTKDSAVRMHWPTAPFALGSYTCYRPGQWIYYGEEGRRVKNLHFCGEHCSLDFQGYMEGACETGAMVAAELLDDLALPLPAAMHRTLEHKLVLPQACYHGDQHDKLRRNQRRRLSRRPRTVLEPVS
ncbi:MAG: FAD-dependent oxidoreductase [Bradymonadaceae bacterium]|nr:FAD-dependent oxidoreductase [Lujinxingiaceae bacterium]